MIVTPVLIFLLYGIAYAIRNSVTNPVTKKYFIPALSAKIIGAIALGLIYQFYYHGGDTFNYHTHGSRHVWNAFMDHPSTGLKLLFGDNTDEVGIYKYSSRIPFFHDRQSYFVIRVASVFDLFTFSSYAATAILFGVLGFVGLWLLFVSFYEIRPDLHKPLAWVILFIPSVIFWGSGLLKDTLTLACLGGATFFVKRIFIDARFNVFRIVILLFCLYVIFSVKKYILLTYLPAVLLWTYAANIKRVRSFVFKAMLFPFTMSIAIALGYLGIEQVGADDPRYALERLGTTAKITAYDIAYQTGKDAGSTYSLGELDGTFSGMVKLAPQAINVSLFRPYLWEARNPLMLISSLEASAMLVITIAVVIKMRKRIFKILIDPQIVFCLVFSLTFAFAVGSSTFNFGTLSRYKIPLLPFYGVALVLMWYYPNNETNDAELDSTE